MSPDIWTTMVQFFQHAFSTTGFGLWDWVCVIAFWFCALITLGGWFSVFEPPAEIMTRNVIVGYFVAAVESQKKVVEVLLAIIFSFLTFVLYYFSYGGH